MFDGENLTTKKHIQSFENFIELFEIEHDDVSMRAFSRSLQGYAKAWFRHLQPQSISLWDELREDFRRFWGERKSWDILISEFYAMRIMKDETISNFSRRFSSLYYKLPNEIQPIEVIAMLHYATTFHPDLSFLLMERRSKSLQKMFNDAQEIQHNIQACKQIQNEELDAKEHDSEYEQKTVDLNLEQRVNIIICSLEVLNANDFAKYYIPLTEK